MQDLSPRTLAAYGAPAIFLAALYLPLFTYVTPFYVSERGVGLAAIGAAWIGIRLFDAVTDPLMGWISDATPSAWGRRRVWLALSAPLICVATWEAFVPPEGAGLGHAVLWLFLLTLGWTMAQTPYTAWGAELSGDYHGRLRVTSWREAMVLFGTIGSTLLYVAGGEGGEGLRAVALAVAIGLPAATLISVLLVPDRQGRGTGPRLSLRAGARTLAANRPFRRLVGAWFVNGLANALPATLFLFFVSDRLGAPEAGGMIFIAYFGSAILGVPLWSLLARRFPKHRVWGGAMLWACVVFTGVLFIGEGDVAAFVVISVLTGLAFGADLTLPPAMQADVVELDTHRTGERRAGIFFAIWQVATKAALALSSGVALMLLDLAGFEPGGANDDAALDTLAFLYAGAPIILKCVAVALVWRFELDRETVEALRSPAAATP